MQQAATEIIREFGLGQYGWTKGKKRRHRRERQRKAKILARNPIFSGESGRSENQSVYVMSDGDAVKIGIAIDVHGRRTDLQTGSAKRIDVLFSVQVDDARAVERECHRRLRQHRLKGEWFHVQMDEAVATVRLVVEQMTEADAQV